MWAKRGKRESNGESPTTRIPELADRQRGEREEPGARESRERERENRKLDAALHTFPWWCSSEGERGERERRSRRRVRVASESA